MKKLVFMRQTSIFRRDNFNIAVKYIPEHFEQLLAMSYVLIWLLGFF